MPDGNEQHATAGDIARTLPPSPHLELIPPDKIRANTENPRLIFPEEKIEELAASFQQIGVQVPLTVYEEEGEGTSYVLLDGECRWRAALRIDLPAVPASVVPKPNGTENLLRMFNIHMLRDEWDEMPTAWALEQLMRDLRTDDVSELARLTGLSRDRVRNVQIVLKYPREVQEAVARGELKFYLLVELWKALGSARRHPERLDYSADQLMRVFLERSLEGRDVDVVEYRKLGKLLSTAIEDTVAGEAAREAVSGLVEQKEQSITDAYEEGAASSIELNRVLRDLGRMPKRLRRVYRTDLHPEQVEELTAAIFKLREELDAILADAGG